MIELIQQRLDAYKAADPVAEAQASKEIIQEIALYALWRADFFECAAFQGGTSLRILHGLPRFSEDLDFMLKEPDPKFAWSGYLEALLTCFEEFGLSPEALPKGAMDNRIKKAIIKDNSIANQLNLSFYQGHENQKLKIKLEIDVLPPADSGFEYSYLDFPLDYEVCHQDLSSNFALKIHALLCRGFLKGRDWYDFNWYVKQKISPNLKHLENALYQYGPWQGDDDLLVDLEWLKNVLNDKIESIDWQQARGDVERFLSVIEQKSLSLWSERFFKSRVGELV
jgi:predicted nucleotidyltransferase component of viral defense system